MKRFCNTNYYKNKYSQIDRICNAPFNLDLAIFGSAYASYDFDFQEEDIYAYNFGFASQFLYYTEFFVKKYISHVRKNGCVAIVLPPLIFMETGEDAYGGRDRYITICEENEFEIKYYHIKKILDCHRALFFPWRWRYCIFDKPLDKQFSEKNELTKEQIERKTDERIASWNAKYQLFDKNDYTNFKEKTKKAANILKNIIGLIENDGKRCCLIVPPVSSSLRSRIPSELLQAILYDRVEETCDVTILDYWNDARFADEQYYIHIDFMNAIGRKEFTKQVVKDLRIKKLL